MDNSTIERTRTGTANVGDAAIAGDPIEQPAMPHPELEHLATSGDLGAELAALVLMISRDRKKAARADRDATYADMDRTQADEIRHMERGATTRLVTGLAQGAAQVGAGAAVFRSAVSEI